MATGTGITAGNRALKSRLRDRKLPSLETRASDPVTQASLETLAEHLRVYEGDVRAPKERFITLKELEDAGLIKTGIKSGYAYIAQALQRDVAQKAGSTANPSLKGVIKKDTSRQARTPGGGGGGGSATNPIEVGKSGQGAKLNDNADVFVPSPAQREFLYYDGSKWTAYPLFKRENKWFAKQYFAGGIDVATLAIDGVDIDTYIPTVTDDLYVDVTGDTMTGILGLTYSATAGARNSTMVLYSGNPQLSIEDTGAAADEGVWNIIGGVDTLKIRALSDDYATAVDVMSFDRGTGTAVDSVSFYKNVVVDTDGVGPMLTLGDGAGADNDSLLRLNTDRPWSFRQWSTGASTALQLFMESSGDKQFHIGSSLTDTAVSIGSESGNIVAAGKIYPGTATGYVGDLTGDYGSVQVAGVEGGATWEGVNIAGRAAFMWNTSEERGGIYDDVNNRWAVQWNPNNASGNEELWLYNGTVAVAKTAQYTATGQTTSLNILDHDGNTAPAGMNIMSVADTNASVSLRAEHCGRVVYHNNGTSYNITMDNNSDFPSGGMCTVISHSDTALTFVQGTGITLIWQDGTATAATGNRTMQYRGVANCWKISSSAWFIWGIGLT